MNLLEAMFIVLGAASVPIVLWYTLLRVARHFSERDGNL